MAIESFQEVEQYFRDNAESEDVSKFTAQFRTELDKENVVSFLESENGRALKQSLTDPVYEKAVADFKERHLDEIVQQEILKKNPPKTDEQKRLLELEKKIENSEAEKLREQLLNNTTKFFAENELLKGYAEYAPTLAELALAGTEDATQQKAELMVKSILGIAGKMRSQDIASRATKPVRSGTSGGIDDIDKQIADAHTRHLNGDRNALRDISILRQRKQTNEG